MSLFNVDNFRAVALTYLLCQHAVK